jgi:hypothetical protein
MRVVDSLEDLPIEISDPAERDRVLLQLSVALESKDRGRSLAPGALPPGGRERYCSTP